MTENKFNQLFGEKIPILGMIHLAGDKPTERALEEIAIYENNGVDGAIIENYHGDVYDVISTLKSLSKNDHKIITGINILPNEYKTAFRLAEEHGAKFIQLDYVAGRYDVSDSVQKLDEYDYLNTRNLYPNVVVLGGVWPKYYHPVPGSSLKKDIKNGMKMADAIVVTGDGTGMETPLNKIKKFREILDDFPLVIGAGLNSLNASEQLKIADGAIVGSCFKPGLHTRCRVDDQLVEEFMEQANKARDYRKV